MSRGAGNTESVARVTVPRLNRVLIGERIQRLRTGRGLTGKQLAKATGIPQGSIGAIETGRMLPDPARLLALATVFGTSVDFILTGGPVIPETTDGDGGVSES